MPLFGRDKGTPEPEPEEQEGDSFVWPSQEAEAVEPEPEEFPEDSAENYERGALEPGETYEGWGNEDSAVLPDEGEAVTAPAFVGGQDVGTPQAEEESVGLYGKFHVERVDGKDRPGGAKEGAKYFVLDYVNDPVARVALRAYVSELRRLRIEPALASDLNDEINSASRAARR